MDPKEWKINSTGYNLQDLKFLVQNIKKGIWTLKWSGLKLTKKI